MPPRSEADTTRRELLAEYGSTPATRRIVDQALAFLERAEDAHALVVTQGLTITNGKGTFVNPAVTVEKNSRVAFLTALRALRQRPLRTKVGAPMMGERLASAQPPASRFFDTPPGRRARTARYITPLKTPTA